MHDISSQHIDESNSIGGIMMEGWKKVRLGDLANITMGQSPPSKDYNNEGHGLPFYQGKTEFGEYYPSIAQYSTSGNKKAEKGDILFTVRAPVGELNISNCHCIIGRGLASIRAKENKHQRFLYYLLKVSRTVFESRSYGAVYDAINAKDLKNSELLIPKDESSIEKISSILSAYDDLIENNLKRIKLLEEKAQLTYEEWFVRMKFPGHETTPINNETGLPEGWEKKTLVDCCDLKMGQSPKSEFYNDQGNGLPFHQGVKDYGFRFPENSSWSTAGNRVAEANSILFSVRAPVGRLNVAIEKIILGRGLAAINHKKGWNNFLLYQLQKIFFEDNLIGGGAIFSSVTKKDVERIKLIHATEDLTRQFNEIAFNVDEAIKVLTKQNKNLKEACDILLPRLMTGIIDVEQKTLETVQPTSA